MFSIQVKEICPLFICVIRVNLSYNIERIEFSPLVEIGASKGHYYPEETTDKGSTRVDADTGTFFKLTNK